MPGVEGVGECATLPDLSCDAKPEYEMTLRQVCQMVEQMGRIPYDMIRAYPSITFGLETAFASFFDAAKKFLEIVPAEGASSSEMLKQKGGSVPAGMENLVDLFDSPFGKGEEGITINGLVWMGTYEEMLARLEEKLQAGAANAAAMKHAAAVPMSVGFFMSSQFAFAYQYLEVTTVETENDTIDGY